MIARTTCHVLPVVFVACLVCAAPAAAVAPEVKDEAKLFSPDAVKKANEQIRDIARKHGRDLLVETFPTVPGGQADQVRDLPTDERIKFFQNWAKERMDYNAVNGVYILACKEPPFLRVEVSEKARGQFGSAFGGELAKVMLRDFKEKNFDDALLKAVKQVQEKLSTKPKK